MPLPAIPPRPGRSAAAFSCSGLNFLLFLMFGLIGDAKRDFQYNILDGAVAGYVVTRDILCSLTVSNS